MHVFINYTVIFLFPDSFLLIVHKDVQCVAFNQYHSTYALFCGSQQLLADKSNQIKMAILTYNRKSFKLGFLEVDIGYQPTTN